MKKANYSIPSALRSKEVFLSDVIRAVTENVNNEVLIVLEESFTTCERCSTGGC